LVSKENGVVEKHPCLTKYGLVLKKEIWLIETFSNEREDERFHELEI